MLECARLKKPIVPNGEETFPMKKNFVNAVIFIVLCPAIIFATGMDGVHGLAHGSVLKGIISKGELVVGTTGHQPPLNATAKDGELIGFEKDMADRMARSLGVKLKMAVMPFSQLLTALEQRKIDMILSGMTMTPERNTRVAFVGPYYISGKGLLTKQEAIASIKQTSEIDRPEITLSALRGSTSQRYVREKLPRAGLIPTKDYEEGIRMVIQGKADAFVADFPICLISAIRHGGEGLIPLIAPNTYEPLGIALPANDPHLINWVKNFLDMLDGSGILDELNNRWFKKKSWLKRLP
jgi:polar amino acid transport system substrate-binding protein